MDEVIKIQIASDLNYEMDSDVVYLNVKESEIKTLINICKRSGMYLILDYRE